MNDNTKNVLVLQSWTFTLDIEDIPLKPENPYMGFVYAVEYGNNLKIGYSADLRSRFKQLSASARNYAKTTVGVVAFSPVHTNHEKNEKILHSYFKRSRIGRTELFSISMDEFIKTMPTLEFNDESAQKELKSESTLSFFKALLLGQIKPIDMPNPPIRRLKQQ